ncbi:MAG: SAM-dependent methyltransferase [Clostridia bacterium]|nr:SAM-dependent methyltransferase [Clostridia bacterium]
MNPTEPNRAHIPAPVPLDPRLAAAASFVRDGSVIADIGTDHAYLPIALLLEGRIPFAVASDVNEGPLMRAKANAEKYGAAERMRFVRSDGLASLEPERDGVRDICVCGMGGELIARIVGASDYTRIPGVRLILQPMSSPEELRRFLDAAGYAILDERLCEAAGKRYACLLAAYDGLVRESTPASLLLGARNIEKKDPLFRPFAEGWLRRVETQIAGRRAGGLDTAEAEELRDEILSILEETP